MKPIIEKVPHPLDYSYTTEYIEVPYFKSRWHFHEKVELIYIKEGRGTGFIGDGISYFSGGEVAIIGSRIPHVWLSDQQYYNPDSDLVSKALVIKFDENFLGDKLNSLPGFIKINELLAENSKRGLILKGGSRNQVSRMMEEIYSTRSDFDRVLHLLQILNIIATTDEYQYVSSGGNVDLSKSSDMERLEKVFKFVKENFREKIELREVAEIANLSPAAFCKYFKSRTLKTFTQFVNEVRIGNACKLLAEENLSVKEICYLSGYNFLSSFYKQFHAIHHISPLEYKEKLFSSELNPGL